MGLVTLEGHFPFGVEDPSSLNGNGGEGERGTHRGEVALGTTPSWWLPLPTILPPAPASPCPSIRPAPGPLRGSPTKLVALGWGRAFLSRFLTLSTGNTQESG